MINEEIRNIKSGRKELRRFGLMMGIVLGLLGGFTWWRDKDCFYYFSIISAFFFFFAFAFPSALKPVNKAWMTLAILMSWVMTRVILSLLFYLGITPMGFLARLFGKDFLELRFNKNTAKSYWIPKERRKFERSDYENQF